MMHFRWPLYLLLLYYLSNTNKREKNLFHYLLPDQSAFQQSLVHHLSIPKEVLAPEILQQTFLLGVWEHLQPMADLDRLCIDFTGPAIEKIGSN